MYNWKMKNMINKKKYMNCVCWYDKIRVLILCVLYCGFDCDVMNVDVIDSVILRNK